MHPHEALTREPGFSAETKFETRVEAAARERREAMAKRRAELEAADARGELWTMQAALYPGKAFVLLYHGDQQDTEPLESQHGAAGGILGPHHLIGSRKEAMEQALAMLSVAEITIRAVD